MAKIALSRECSAGGRICLKNSARTLRVVAAQPGTDMMNHRAKKWDTWLFGLGISILAVACSGGSETPNGDADGTGGTGGIATTGGTTGSGGNVGEGTGGNFVATGGLGAGDGGDSAGGGGLGTGGGSGGAVENLGGVYVAPDGDDANSGTLEAPFLTLARARDEVRTMNAAMSEDLHVYLRGGVYRLEEPVSFSPEDSGMNGHRIHYESYPGETAVLSGSVPVSGWAPHEGDIYVASLDRATKLRNLYVNDQRALMASVRIPSQGGFGTYSVTSGQADWAWMSGSGSDGLEYSAGDLPEIATNKDDLEVVNGTTWNENIVCTRDVTTEGGSRVLWLQQPYGGIAQLPGWNAGFSVNGTHTIFNAYEFLSEPGTFYFDKTAGQLYYIPRPGEDMATAEVEAPSVETLIKIQGNSLSERVQNLTFRGITFENTDYNLYEVDGSRGKASVQGATVYKAYGDGNWHNTQYEILDTFPGVIMVSSASGIEITGSVVKHSGSEGISMINDVVESHITGTVITDIAGSGITVGHPQHVYLGDEGTHAAYNAEIEGICTNNTIENNLLYDISTLPGFGGHSGITAFYTDNLRIEHNQIQLTAYNGVNMGWGWINFPDSTTARDNSVSYNRFIDTLSRLHDSGAIYTIGQNPGTQINENYVQGIPPAVSGPTYGLHNDEGSAYITENDNVLDIDPGVHYTINCEDFGGKHDLTILRTYATVNKMGINPPSSTIDPPVAVPDNVWPRAQYEVCVASGIDEAHQGIIFDSLQPLVDRVFPASAEVEAGDEPLPIRSSGADYVAWFAPEGTTVFAEGVTMTRAEGTATSIAIPTQTGTYRMHLVDLAGQKVGESETVLRVE